MIANMHCVNPVFSVSVLNDRETLNLTVYVNHADVVHIKMTKAHAVALVNEMEEGLKEMEHDDT